MPDHSRRSLSDRLFSWLLALLPRDFRSAHGTEMAQVFRAERDEAARSGRVARWQVSTRTLLSLLVTAPREHLAGVLSDARYALRMLRQQPAFTLSAIVTFGVGIAASTTVLTVTNAFLFRPLPVADPEQLVSLSTVDSHFELPHGLSYAEVEDYRDLSDVFSGVIAWSPFPAHLGTDGSAERMWMCAVTDDYFAVLGVSPALGRTIVIGEERLDTNGEVLVLSHGYWQLRFGGDPDVLGRSVTINGRPFTVIGVLPESFTGTDTLLDMPVFTSIEGMMHAFDAFPRDRRDAHSLRVLARLQPDVPLAQARAAVDVHARRIADAYPETSRGVSMVVVPERQARPEPSTGRIFQTAALAFGVLAAVLLVIVCANVANLQLARGSARAHEIGVRVVLGARPRRLMRQLLTESVILALLGTGLGVLLAAWIAGAIKRGLESYPSSLTLRVDFGLDWRVLAITALIAVLAGMAAGLLPARQALRTSAVEPLKRAGRGATSGRSRRMRDALVVVQVAFSLTLLVVAGLFARSMDAARNIDMGFSTRSMLLLSADPSLQGYGEQRRLEYYDQALERVRALPGVRRASWSTFVPFTGTVNLESVDAEGAPVRPANERYSVLTMAVSDDYFATMGMPIVGGRPFNTHDRENAPRVVIVNRTLARLLWPDESAVGRRLWMNDPGDPLLEVVGVAGDAKYLFLWEDPRPMLMLPIAQSVPYGATLQVASDGDPAALTPAVRAAVSELDSDLPLYDVKTLERHLRDGNAFGPLQLAADLATIVGLVGLLLAVVGLYGVLAYTVNQRKQEIGVRMALGADRGRIIRLVVRHSLLLSLAGLVLGTILAFWMTRLVGSLLVDVRPEDPTVYIVTGGILLAVALVACYLPARRALRVDPVSALRAD